MSLDFEIAPATSKAIADLSWEVHLLRNYLQSLDSRLDAYNTIGLAVVKELMRIADVLVDIGVSIETRP